jgi:cephalosporin-C deacetylase-like acetyl esterase
MDRTDVTFLSQGTRCAAWLYRPVGPAPYPCVILAHGLGATRDMKLAEYAEHFVEAGLAALVFDYRHFGASDGEPRQLLDIQRELADWAAAIVYVRTLDGIDPERIALWGTSFSGGHAIVTAARDQHIAAVVAQVPFTDGTTAIAGQGFFGSLQLLQACIYDKLRQLLNMSPYYIKVAGVPGSLAALRTPGALEGFQKFASQEHWDDYISARVLLHIGFYRPIQSAPRVSCPLLICICEDDQITSSQAALKMAEVAPHAEVLRYPGDHFHMYLSPLFEQAVTAQRDFFVRHLLDNRNS